MHSRGHALGHLTGAALPTFLAFFSCVRLHSLYPSLCHASIAWSGSGSRTRNFEEASAHGFVPQASGFVPLPGITGGPSLPAEVMTGLFSSARPQPVALNDLAARAPTAHSPQGLHESLAAKTNCRYPPNEPCEASGRCRVDGQRCSIRKSLANAISSTHTALCADARCGSPMLFLCHPHPARRGTDAKGNMHDHRFADVLHSCSAGVGARCFRTLVEVSNLNP